MGQGNLEKYMYTCKEAFARLEQLRKKGMVTDDDVVTMIKELREESVG